MKSGPVREATLLVEISTYLVVAEVTMDWAGVTVINSPVISEICFPPAVRNAQRATVSSLSTQKSYKKLPALALQPLR